MFPLALALAPLVGAAPPDHKPQPFAAVVEANFAKWDANHDGKLTAVEVDKAVADHANTGDAAAAVAAVHVRFRGANPPASVTKTDLTHGNLTAAARRDQDDHAAHFAADYGGFARHIAKAPRKVLATPDAPVLDGMAQGRLGDCYFVSAVGAAVHRNPQAVRKMFREHPDGSVDVTFPGGRTVRVGKLTDAEVALGSTAGDHGLWLNALEKAFGELKIQTPRAKARHAGDIDLDVIARGGDADETIALLTGYKATFGDIRKGKDKPPPSDRELPVLQAQLHTILHAAAVQHALVCAGTSNGSKLPPGIATGHDYAILGYDAGTKTVHVWNPWGSNYHFTPKGAAGLDHGYEVKGGHFDVPLADFVRIFECVFYETRVPAKK